MLDRFLTSSAEKLSGVLSLAVFTDFSWEVAGMALRSFVWGRLRASGTEPPSLSSFHKTRMPANRGRIRAARDLASYLPESARIRAAMDLLSYLPESASGPSTRRATLPRRACFTAPSIRRPRPAHGR